MSVESVEGGARCPQGAFGDSASNSALGTTRSTSIRTASALFGAALFGSSLPSSGAEPPASSERAFYAARIQPIFDRSCVACHGPDKKKAGLRLDAHAAVLKGGNEGPVVVAGAPEKSELYRRMTAAASTAGAREASVK